MKTSRKALTLLAAAALALTLTACNGATDCGTPRGNGNPAQSFHAACDK